MMLTIKKIPICPFCNAEMNRDAHIYDGVYLPTKVKTIKALPSTEFLSGIEEHTALNIFVCSDCGFVALWKDKT